MNLFVSRNERSPIGKLRLARWFMRLVALLQTFCFLFVFYSPAARAAVESTAPAQTPVEQVQGGTDEEKLGKALQKIKENVASKKAVVDGRVLEESGIVDVILEFFGLSSLQNESLDQVTGLYQQVQSFNQQALANFRQIEDTLVARGLPDEILQRHYATVSAYEASFAEFQGLIQAAIEAGSLLEQQDALDALDRFLKEQKFKRKQQDFDPDDLPNQVLQPDNSNTPKTTRDDFIQGGLQDSPPIRLAALGYLSFDKLDQANDPAYLAATDEVVLSQPIRDQAEALGYDAVRIYHWVRNNIEWIPGWGAVQNAELTLFAKRGNAMDIASLTIALLRASLIPARYVHGTIEVQGEAYLNWMGGFTSLNAAADYASSNGIPTSAIISGGQIGKIQMEHVWVEAATDFYPSRGAVNLDADIWLELDPSFKQYEFLQGLDTAVITGLDADQLAQDFVSSGDADEVEGWASGFDSNILAGIDQQVQQSLDVYTAANPGDATVGGLIGGAKTILRQFPTLPSALPNRVVVAGVRYDSLPALLQQKVTWGLGKDLFGQPLNSVTLPFARVNNEKVTLSFAPATEADRQALDSLLPDDVTDIGQLPDSLPAYLVNVVPELKLDGALISRGSPMRLGEEIDLVTQVKLVDRPVSNRAYSVIAGSYLAVNAYAQSVSIEKLQAVQNRLETTRGIVEGGDAGQIASLGRQQLLGDMYYAGGLAYYSQLIWLSRIFEVSGGNHHGLKAGMGTTGYEPNVDTFFGIPRAITTGATVFDIPLITTSSTDDGDPDKTRQFNLQTGILSSMLEHAVPELMNTSDDPADPQPDAISAVKALQKAQAAGQRIYRITRDNMTAALQAVQHNADTMAEIRASLNAGKVVITHTGPVSMPEWTGAGYVILDDVTGVGAYKISGGANGGLDGADKAVAMMALYADFKESLAKFAGVGEKTGIGRFMKLTSQFFGILGFGIAALDIAITCTGDGVYMMMYIFTMMTWLMLIILAAIANPLIGFLFAAAASVAIGQIVSRLKETHICKS